MSKTTESLILSGNGYEITIAPEAEALKAEIIASAQAIVTVGDNAQSETARAKAAEIAKIRIAVEKTRKEIKAPVLDVGKRIDQAAADYMAALEAEEARLTGLIKSWAIEVERQRQEAERQRREAEREALRKQMAEESARRAEEEKARQEAAAAEAARRAAEAAQFEAKTKKQAEAARLAAEQAEAERVAAQQREAEAAKAREVLATKEPVIDEFEAALLAPAPRKVEGVKFDLDFEVVNVHQLYHAAPSLCDVTARRSAVLAALKQQEDNNIALGFPGILVTRKPKVSTR